VIVLYLTGMVALIMMRTLRREIAKYKENENGEEVCEEAARWKKLLHDVFRPPDFPMLLAVSVGSGSQTFGTAVVTLAFAVLIFLSPANRGSLMLAMVILLALMSAVAGYVTARTYKMFKGKLWKEATLLVRLLFVFFEQCCSRIFRRRFCIQDLRFLS